MEKHQNRRSLILLLLLIISITGIFSGCNVPQKPGETMVPTETLAAEVTEEAEIEITPTPSHEAIRTVLSNSEGMNAGILNRFRAALEELPEWTLSVEELDLTSPDTLPDDAKIVIFAGNPTNLVDLQQRAPEAQFIIVDTENRGDSNVWTIGYDPAHQMFMAGYAIGLTANDWRGGGLIPSESDLFGASAGENFSNGMRFFCGRCQSYGPPYVVFPQNVELPAGSSSLEWASGIDQLSSSFVNTWFVSDDALNTDVLSKIEELNGSVMTSSPKPEDWQGNWLGMVRIDPGKTLIEIIHRIENGEPATSVIAEIEIEAGQHRGLFSDGKKIDMKKVYMDLVSGFISPFNPVPPSSFQQ